MFLSRDVEAEAEAGSRSGGSGSGSAKILEVSWDGCPQALHEGFSILPILNS